MSDIHFWQHLRSSLETVFVQEFAERLGWTLLHTLWQFAVIAFLLWLACRFVLARRAPQTRYLAACLALSCTVLAACVTYVWLPAPTDASRLTSLTDEDSDADVQSVGIVDPAAQPPASLSRPPALTEQAGGNQPVPDDAAPTVAQVALASSSSGTQSTSWYVTLGRLMEPHLATIALCWLLGVLLFSLRPLTGCLTVRRLRRQGVSPVSSDVQLQMDGILARMNMHRAVEIVQSALVDVPAAVGYFQPLILLPISAITGLSREQLQAVLAHELSHIRRHDYLVNVLQTGVETLLFYHPLVWWISGCIRTEREHCCDDVAASLSADRRIYASALLAIDEMRSPRHVLVMSATGSTLRSRIQRIAGRSIAPSQSIGWWGAVVSAVMAASTIGLVLGIPAETPILANPAEQDTPIAAAVTATTEVLSCRLVPVSAAMSEEAINLTEQRTSFATPADVAFAVELKNNGKSPVKILDTRYGHGYGESKGKPSSDWFGQFLFSFEFFDVQGRTLQRPDVQVVDLDMPVSGALVVELAPGGTHRFLLRPNKWLAVMRQHLRAGRYQVAVRYHGMPDRAAKRLREYRPDSPNLEVAACNVVSDRVEFELRGSPPTHPDDAQLVWGEAQSGLRSAMAIVSAQKTVRHGQKIKVQLYVQNVSDKAVILPALLWRSEFPMQAQDEQGQDIAIKRVMYSGWVLSGRINLQPRQITVLDVGNLGIAASQEQADAFEHITNRYLVVPAGKYRLRLSGAFGKQMMLRDGKGKQLAPLQGDWQGDVATGWLPVTVAEQAVPAGLKRKVSLKTKRGVFHEALSSLCQQAGLKLDLDGDSLKSLGYTRNMVVEADLQNVPVEQALTKIVGRYDSLAFVLDGDTVFVGSEKAVAARRAKKKQADPQERSTDEPPAKQQAQPKPDKIRATNASEAAEPVTSIAAQVWGRDLSMSQVKVTATFSETPAERWKPGKTLATREYTTDEEGRYQILIPQDLIGDKDVQVSVRVTCPGAIHRTIGPLAVSDFRMQRIGTDEAYWLHRQLSRQAILRTSLKNGKTWSSRVVLPDGSPAVGARVVTTTKYVPYSWKFHSAEDYSSTSEARTDETGRFSLVIERRATLAVMMPGQATLLIDNLRPFLEQNAEAPLRLPKAIRPHGRVLKANGQPIPGAIIRLRRNVLHDEFDMPLSFHKQCAADSDGEYMFPPVAADDYVFEVHSQIVDATEFEAYNAAVSRNETPSIAQQPLTDVIFDVTRKLGADAKPQVRLVATDTVDIVAQVEFPDGPLPEDTVTGLTAEGRIGNRQWSGPLVPLDPGGVARLAVPRGVQHVSIKTGLVRVQRGLAEPLRIGTALYLGTVAEEITGIRVVRRRLGLLKVALDLPESVRQRVAAHHASVSITARHAEPGFFPGRKQLGSVYLQGSVQTGLDQYRGYALPDSPVILQISLKHDGGVSRQVLHEERLTLSPGEELLRRIRVAAP